VRTAKDSDEEEEIQPGAWCSSSYEVVVSASTEYSVVLRMYVVLLRSSMCSVVRSFPGLSVPSVVPSSTATTLYGN
jgi:hypothetical protein